MSLFKGKPKEKKILKETSFSEKIDIFDDDSVKFWCGKFNCTEQELVDVVNRVGSSESKLKKYFGA